jgi:hypothetical protein
MATCVTPLPVKFTCVGVTRQVRYCGALDVQPSVTVSFTVPVSVNPTTIFPPGFVVTLVEVPADGVNVKLEPLLNVAVTLSAALIVTTQLPVPLHAPLQPANVLPKLADCVSVTCVPLAKLAEQPSGQMMPAGLLVTLPLPVPARATVNAYVVVALNVAVADCAEFIVIVHVVPPQSWPPHPAKVEPLAGVSVNVTVVPLLKVAEQPVLDPVVQLIPAGLLVTVPLPVPAVVTVSE